MEILPSLVPFAKGILEIRWAYKGSPRIGPPQPPYLGHTLRGLRVVYGFGPTLLGMQHKAALRETGEELGPQGDEASEVASALLAPLHEQKDPDMSPVSEGPA